MRKLIILSMLIFNTIVTAEDLILDGRTIPLDSTSTLSIDPITGNIIATSANGDLTCSEVGFPPTLSLSASPSAVNSGESSVVSWTLGNDATTCTKSGGWSGNFTGADVTNGTHSQTMSNLTLSTTYNLVCSNNFGSSPQRSTIVSVNGGNPNCVTQPPILNGNEDFSIKIVRGTAFGQPGSPPNPLTYDGTYDDIAPGVGWPGVLGTQSDANLTKNNYIAMQFNTDTTNATARFSLTTPGNAQGPPTTATTVAISECPGDFTEHLGQSRCLSVGGANPNLTWSQNPAANAVLNCKLDKNKTYYLNIVHSNSTVDGYVTSGCDSSEGYCGIIFSHTELN